MYFRISVFLAKAHTILGISPSIMRGGHRRDAPTQEELKSSEDKVTKRAGISKSDTNKKCSNESKLILRDNIPVRVHSDYDQCFMSNIGKRYRHSPSLEPLDEVGPLINEFRRRKDSWTKATCPWWIGNKLDFGDYWPGCKKLPYALREGIDKLIEGDSKEIVSQSSTKEHTSVARLLLKYLNDTTFLFAQLPQGYIDKDELKVPEAPQHPPIWEWSEIMMNDYLYGTPRKVVHYGLNLSRVFYRRFFLLRLLNGLGDQKQAIIYVNDVKSVEWLTLWLMNQGLPVQAIHQRLLMAHVHWILSEFSLQKFSVLVVSNDQLHFRSVAPHFGNVGLVLHYEIPTSSHFQNWSRRNDVVASTTVVSPLSTVTFFRNNSPADKKFMKLVEESSGYHNNESLNT